MSFECGFFNSFNHDRVYDARQFHNIWEGVINDGVYMSIGERFAVTSNSGMNIAVGSGRAWFDGTWSVNDARYILEVEPSDILMPRIDTVVIEINHDARDNYLKVVKGVPALEPLPPTLIKTLTINQYPLADIYVDRGAIEIGQSNITNRIGTSDTPFVTGIIQTINIDMLVAKWEAEWEEFKINNTKGFDDWLNEKKIEFQQMIQAIDTESDLFLSTKKTEFEEWFQNLQSLLDGDIATKLAERILKLENRWTILGKEYEYRDSIDGSDGTAIIASDGNEIQGRVVYTLVD